MQIDGRQIGPGHPPYIVAELSGEHRGSYDRCRGLIRAAKEAGADAAKLQCFEPFALSEARGGADKVLALGLWAGRTLYSLYCETYTRWGWFPELFGYAREIGITLFSSVFDEESLRELEGYGLCPAYKISSFEFTDLPLIGKVAATRKPMIMSVPATASASDIRGAMLAAVNLDSNIAYLHCVSEYPAADPHFERLAELQERLGHWVVGFSDHTLGIASAVEAVKRGASIIEKHLTLSRAEGGPDKAFSLEPAELAQLVQACKVEQL
jgi:N-acetylneuraminate synthase